MKSEFQYYYSFYIILMVYPSPSKGVLRLDFKLKKNEMRHRMCKNFKL